MRDEGEASTALTSSCFCRQRMKLRMIESPRLTRARLTLATLLCLFVLLPADARAQDGPPKEEGSFLKPDLVELTKLDDTIKLDVRYATANNFAGRAVRSEERRVGKECRS